MQPVSGGVATPVTDFRDKTLFSFEYDWKHGKLAAVRGVFGTDVVLITDSRSDNLRK